MQPTSGIVEPLTKNSIHTAVIFNKSISHLPWYVFRYLEACDSLSPILVFRLFSLHSLSTLDVFISVDDSEIELVNVTRSVSF